MTKAKVKKLENIFRSDIRWAIRHGLKWNAGKSAVYTNGKWVSEDLTKFFKEKPPKVCGVCAVAAHVVRHQTSLECDNFGDADIIQSASKNLRVNYGWLDQVYWSVMDEKSQDEGGETFDSPERFGHKLRDYAEAYTKKYKAAQKLKRARARTLAR